MYKISSYRKMILISLASLFLFSACLEMEDPDDLSPDEVLKEILPLSQRTLTYWKTAEIGRYSAIWTQQLAGVRGIEQTIDRYDPPHTATNKMWSEHYNYVNLYFKNLIYYATEANSKAYRGIGRILQAYSIGLMTDAFGHIPFSEADKYLSAHEEPGYDDQEMILLHIIEILDAAIVDLQNALNGEGMVPGPAEDHMYGGDLNQWMKAARMLQIRYMTRFAHFRQEYTSLYSAVQETGLFTSNADNLIYSLPDMRGSENPYYHYDLNIRNTRVGQQLVNMLKETNDPRLPRLVKMNTNNEYVGSLPGESKFEASLRGNAVAGRYAPIVFLSYPELKFLQAEAFYRYGEQAMADQAYTEGVKASLEWFGAENPQWVQEHAYKENVSLQQIIEAKYIALFMQQEVWADYRRTGFPELIPFEEVSEEIPRRKLYPEDELTHNPHNVYQDETIFDRVWWDDSPYEIR